MRQTIWVIGGDERSHWAARALVSARFSVFTHDVPQEPTTPLPEDIPIAVLPFPSLQGESIRGHDPLAISELLRCLSRSSSVFGGLFGQMKGAFSDRGAAVYDLYGTEPLTTENARLTAEGALELAMERSPLSLHGARCLVIGYGRIGKCLARKLSALSSDVTVAARKKSDLALAEAMGFQTDRTGIYLHGLSAYDFIFNTVPAQVLTDIHLRQIPPDTLLMDLASRPGGFSPLRSQELALNFCIAPGLPGRCCPKSAGIAYARSIISILDQEGAV